MRLIGERIGGAWRHSRALDQSKQRSPKVVKARNQLRPVEHGTPSRACVTEGSLRILPTRVHSSGTLDCGRNTSGRNFSILRGWPRRSTCASAKIRVTPTKEERVSGGTQGTQQDRLVKVERPKFHLGKTSLGSHPDVSRMMSGAGGQDESHMSTSELIALHGYIPETHKIWTEDGYCLEVHRVLPPKKHQETNGLETSYNGDVRWNVISNHGSNETETVIPQYDKEISRTELVNNTDKRPPVIVHHGLLSSSADWVLLGPKKALAYALCDEGYDVWLTNARGNAYSKHHKRYCTKDKEFWDFSWHEIGYYDLPATIDYVLEKTGHSELYYVGYSQGTTAFFVMGSERPEYNNKIKGVVSMAPITFLSNQRSPLLKLVVHFYVLMEWGSMYCNLHQWFPRNRLQARALGTLLRNAPGPLTKGFCNCWFYLIAGFGSDQLDKSMLPLIFGHFPAGSSAKQIIHYSQSILSGGFRKFDYGPMENLKVYGSTQPPKYDLEKIKVPVAVIYSGNDFLTDPVDVKKLVDKLPNVVENRKVSYSKFNHIDYLWGRDARTLVYNDVLAALKKF